MTPPKIAVIEEPPAETIARLRQQLQEVEEERDGLRIWVVRQTEARDKALTEATALHQSLVNATASLATVRADGVQHAARAIEAREVAAWLLAEWTDPANWSEAITAAEAKFGKLDWLREGKG